MQTTPEHQFGYFLQLERMVKLALAMYGSLLIAGILTIILGIDSIIQEVVRGNYRLLILTIFGAAGIFLGTFAFVEKVQWISKLNVWLDRKFFRILDRSNTILFNTVFESVGSEFRPSPELIDDRNKHSFTQNIFRRLATEDHIFQYLLDSNVFRLWIWYWILLYGSFTFTLLTACLFASVTFTLTPAIKLIFASVWVSALLHIGLGFFLGKQLIHLTQSTASTILSSYRNDIAAMLKESLPDRPLHADEG